MTDSIALLQERLDQYPSGEHLSVEGVLREFPHLCDDQRAIKTVIVESYVRELEHGNRISPSEFIAQFPGASSCLARQLWNLADLHRQAGLWSDGGAQQPAYPAVGETIRGYSLLREIGRGAFSRVFLAADENVGLRRVAVKFTSHGSNELALLGTLDHPHLPRILTSDFDAEHDLRIICMEYVGTRSLIDLIEEMHCPEPAPVTRNDTDPRRHLAKALTAIRQVADALAYAHERGTLHLDVKPANILLREDDSAVLIDFNLSAPAAASHSLGFRGTLAYAAPEVIESAVSGDLAGTPMCAASDVYSLGVVLFEALTGRLPWPDGGNGTIDTSARHALAQRRQRVVPPSTINPGGVDSDLDRIVLTALSWSPENRFATVGHFRDALADYGDARTRRRSRAASAIILGLCVATIACFILFRGSTANLSDVGMRGSKSVGTPIASALPNSAPPRRVLAEESSEQFPPVRWGDLTERELSGIMQLIEDMPQPADYAIRSASKGHVLLLLSDYDGAAVCFREASSRGLSGDAGLLANLGYCCVQQRKFVAAAKVLDAALELSAEHEIALFLRSIVEVELSRNLHRAPDPIYLDRLIARRTTTSTRFAHAAICYCDQSLSSNAADEPDVANASAYRQRGLQAVAESNRITSAGLQECEVFQFSPHDVRPLPDVREAFAAGIGLSAAFSPNVESYIDAISKTREEVAVDETLR